MVNKGNVFVCSLEKHKEILENEVKLEYDRTMNRMIFDNVVMNNPKEYLHITLPQKDSEYVPQKGKPINLGLHSLVSVNGVNTKDMYCNPILCI